MLYNLAVVQITVLGFCALAACGDDKAPGASGDLDDADVLEPDASDAGTDADGDAELDSEAPVDVDGGTSQCEGDVLDFDVANGVGRPFSSAIIGNRVHLVYTVPSGGSSLAMPVGQGLAYVGFDTTGEAETAIDIVNVGVEVYNKTRDPSLVARGGDLDLFYTSNEEGSYELYYKDLDANGTPVRQTNNARNEYYAAGSAFGDSAAVLFSDEPGQSSAPGAVALIVMPGQAPIELVAEAKGLHAGQLAFAQIGDGASGQGGLGFVSNLPESRGIYFQALSSSGQPQGELSKLSSETGGASNIDIAPGASGGAVIYTEAPGGTIHQLRFRELSPEGTVSSVVRNLTSANQDLRDVAISKYSAGYVIAYRRLGGAPGAATSVYLKFVDAQGNEAGTRLVSAAAVGGSGIDVLVANDGRLVVLWADAVNVLNSATNKPETHLRVHAARLTCVVTKP